MTLGLRKRPLPLHAIGPDDLALDFAHRWWHARRDGGLLPARAAVDTPEFRLLVGGVGWVDVAAPDPAGWELDAALALLRGGGAFRAVTWPPSRRACAGTSRRSGSPARPCCRTSWSFGPPRA
jgi:hypothetical protein